jgi:hypothetical protein
MLIMRCACKTSTDSGTIAAAAAASPASYTWFADVDTCIAAVSQQHRAVTLGIRSMSSEKQRECYKAIASVADVTGDKIEPSRDL